MVWGPWGRYVADRHLLGQQVGRWQSETLDPSFLSIGVRVKGPGLSKKATKKPSKAPSGGGAGPREAGSRVRSPGLGLGLPTPRQEPPLMALRSLASAPF